MAAFRILLLLLFLLVFLSLPVTLTVYAGDGAVVYVRLIFSGMIFRSDGHTGTKKKKTNKKAKKKLPPAVWLPAARRVLAFLPRRISVSVMSLDIPTKNWQNAAVYGAASAVAGCIFALFAGHTADIQAEEDAVALVRDGVPSGSVRLRFAVADLLFAFLLGLFVLLQRICKTKGKKNRWRKTK